MSFILLIVYINKGKHLQLWYIVVDLQNQMYDDNTVYKFTMSVHFPFKVNSNLPLNQNPA